MTSLTARLSQNDLLSIYDRRFLKNLFTQGFFCLTSGGLIGVLDWYTKKIVGYDLSIQSKSQDWQCALNKAVNNQFPQGIRKHKNLCLVSDNGCQPTSESFMKACHVLGIKQIFTSYNNPKGNADTERVIRTLKEDLIWPNDWQNPFELQQGLDKWVDEYNNDYPHSSLKHKTPCEFEKMCALNTY
jgi:transposase InsO family protein